MKNKLLASFAILVLMVGFSCAQSSDTYLETLQKINTKIDTSEKNVRDDINSFNEAFKDTFTLIDDEISRLIIANAAMVGGVFAIMFLVYAKTTSRTKRDIQVLLAAHAKHIDTLITVRLEELEMRIDERFKAKDTTTLSKLGADFDFIATGVFDEERKVAETKRTSLSGASSETKIAPRKIEETIYTEEAKLEMFGMGVVSKGPSSGGALKRMKRGFMKLLGRHKPKDVVEDLNKK